MAIASKLSAADVNPRWIMRTATAGFIGICACTIFIKNILPHGQHEYGWPLVFSAEVVTGPNGSPITYGPWPVCLPVPRTTSRILFLADLVFAEIYLALAAIIPRYWLRRYSVSLRYRLLSLLMLTTATACVLSIFKCGSIAGSGWQIANFIYDVAIQLMLNAVPIGLIITAAHWCMPRSEVDNSRQTSVRVRVLTWLAVLSTGGPLLDYMFFQDGHYSNPPVTFTKLQLPWQVAGGYGWPLAYQVYSVDDSGIPVDADGSEAYTSIFALSVDIAAWLMIAISSGFVVNRWTRQIVAKNGIRIRPLLCAVLAVVVASAIMQHEQALQPHWYHYYSLLFGLVAILTTAMLPIAYHWAAFPKFCLAVWIYVSLMLWLGAPAEIFESLLHSNEFRICAAAAFVAGAGAASLCDAFYRFALPDHEVPERLFRPALGEHLSIVPMWLVGLLAVSGGVLLIYR